jgi:serine phosphatase RsbU (regulator of sigma subunit)
MAGEGADDIQQDAMNFYSLIADQISSALERADMRTVRERVRVNSDLLNRIGSVLDATDTPSERAEALMAALVPSFADFAVLETIDRYGAAHPIALCHREPALMRQMVEADAWTRAGIRASNLDWIAAAEVADRYDEKPADSGMDRPAGHSPFPAVHSLSTVLRAHGSIRGRLTIARSAGSPFDDDGAKQLDEIAARIALAFENMTLFERERGIARTLQQSLMPDALPTLQGYDFGTLYLPHGAGIEVGGDFYDVFSTPHGFAATVGDVCGKGAAAARLTALCRYTIRAAAMRERDGLPSGILSQLNDALVRQTGSGEFATVMYARLLTAENDIVRATVCSAGHPPAMIVRVDGTVETCSAQGTVLGITPHPKLEDRTIELMPGESLVVVSDGITEARDPGGNLFGEDRLRTAVGNVAPSARCAQEIADGVYRTLGLFQDGVTLRDDLVILVVRRTAPARWAIAQKGPDLTARVHGAVSQ